MQATDTAVAPENPTNRRKRNRRIRSGSTGASIAVAHGYIMITEPEPYEYP
jgi:hypothetical protein